MYQNVLYMNIVKHCTYFDILGPWTDLASVDQTWADWLFLMPIQVDSSMALNGSAHSEWCNLRCSKNCDTLASALLFRTRSSDPLFPMFFANIVYSTQRVFMGSLHFLRTISSSLSLSPTYGQFGGKRWCPRTVYLSLLVLTSLPTRWQIQGGCSSFPPSPGLISPRTSVGFLFQCNLLLEATLLAPLQFALSVQHHHQGKQLQLKLKLSQRQQKQPSFALCVLERQRRHL